MLNAAHRLPASFRFSSPQILRTPFFHVRYAESTHRNSRLGVVVAKRVSQKAVVRNRLKRLVHTQVYLSLPSFTKSVDMLFILQPQAGKAEEHSVIDAITKALSTITT